MSFFLIRSPLTFLSSMDVPNYAVAKQLPTLLAIILLAHLQGASCRGVGSDWCFGRPPPADYASDPPGEARTAPRFQSFVVFAAGRSNVF